jgi:Papain-like cysteine protease AvrRpt2
MPFQMETQTQTLWCWAAVAVSIDRFFSPTAKQTQCQVAQAVLKSNVKCCANPKPCNKEEHLETALSAVGNLRQAMTRPLDFDEVQEELDAGLPVCARIGWTGGGGHFVTLAGYKRLRSGGIKVHVADPKWGSSIVEFEEFRASYMGRGEWTDTFLVKP